MRRRWQLSLISSSDESDGTDLESCFDTEDKAGEIDSDINVEGGDEASGMSIIDEDEDEDYSLEYYLN